MGVIVSFKQDFLTQRGVDYSGFSPEALSLEYDVAVVIQEQEENGWLLDIRGAIDLLNTLQDEMWATEAKVRGVFGPRYVDKGVVTPKYKKDGTLSTVGLKHLTHPLQAAGPFTRIDMEDFLVGSREQIGSRLLDMGWKPKEFTPTGQPKVSETILESLKYPVGQDIAHYLMLQKRVAMLSSWIEAAGDDDRVHGKVDTCGTVSGRMSHHSPNMAQVVANHKPFGEAMRSLWVAPEGYKVVGADAQGLELRVLAHFMDDVEYVSQILEGDIHSYNQEKASLPTRDTAKTFIYAFIYGAGDSLIGKLKGGGAKQGKLIKAEFLAGLPALKSLQDKVEKACRRGHLRGLDGRKLPVRSPHSALNLLLQGAGAVIMKRALIIAAERVKLEGYDAKFINNCHDEFELEVLDGQEDEVGQLLCDSIRDAGEYYGLRCPMAGAYMTGKSWAEVH